MRSSVRVCDRGDGWIAFVDDEWDEEKMVTQGLNSSMTRGGKRVTGRLVNAGNGSS